jgi:hypothetical protein
MSFGVREHPRSTIFAEGSEREAVPHGTVIKGLGSFPKVWVFHSHDHTQQWPGIRRREERLEGGVGS